MSESTDVVKSFVGGWSFSYRRLAPLSAGRVTWPFGRLDVYRDRLVFRARGPLCVLIPERVVELDAVTGTERRGRNAVRVLHDDGYTSWAAIDRDSVRWLTDHLSRLSGVAAG